MFLSAIYFAVTHALVKFMSRYSLLRVGFLGLWFPFVMCWVSLSLLKIPKWEWIKKSYPALSIWNGGTKPLFYSLQTLPLATAVTFTFPHFTVLVSGFVLQENKTFYSGYFCWSFLWVLILKGFDARIEMIPLILAVTASLFSGICLCLGKKTRKNRSPLVVVMYFPLVTIPVVGPWALSHWI